MSIRKFFDQKIIISVIIISVVFLVYSQVSQFEFVDYDDPEYVSYSSRELSLKNIGETFLSINSANWHPLTWLSLMLDYNLYGLNAGGYHVTNLILHIINTLLLFLLLIKMTGATYKSAFVAVLFALHPLHVESVTWVTERKDVLSTLFWFLTMWAYISYTEKPGILKYLSIVVLFVLGLMAKPMLVTVPFVLLLLDYWPLGRTNWGQNVPNHHLAVKKQTLSFLFVEKIPLLIITIASSILTYIVQNTYHAVVSFHNVSLSDRVINAINSYTQYLEKIFCFQNLSPFYVYSTNFNFWVISGSFLLILVITCLVIMGIKKFPYLAVGWFWYLGTLIPVIGLVQVGSQSMADRYAYVPLIGIFIMMAWGFPQLLSGVQYRKIITASTAVIFIVIITSAAYLQIGVWKNNLTLFGHALKLNPKNYTAWNILGVDMAKKGNYEKALYYYYMAIKNNPKYDSAYVNAGIVFDKMNKYDDAINCYKKALKINNNSAETNYNLGIVLMKKNNLKEAIFYLKRALKVTPDDSDTHNNLGIVLMRTGNIQEAILHFQEALRLKPRGEEAGENLQLAIAVQKRNTSINRLSGDLKL